MNGQDWTPVVFHKRIPSEQAAPKAPVGKKGKLVRELADATEAIKVAEKISLSLSKTIQQARAAKKMTQSELAKKVNVQSKTVADYEAGRVVPDAGILSKLSRVLGVTLKKNSNKKATAKAA